MHSVHALDDEIASNSTLVSPDRMHIAAANLAAMLNSAELIKASGEAFSRIIHDFEYLARRQGVAEKRKIRQREYHSFHPLLRQC